MNQIVIKIQKFFKKTECHFFRKKKSNTFWFNFLVNKMNKEIHEYHWFLIAIEKLRNIYSRMDEILPGLFIAGLREARKTELLEKNRIMAVVPIHDFQRDYALDPKIDVLRIHLADVPQADVLSHFLSVNLFIHSNRLNNSRFILDFLSYFRKCFGSLFSRN